MLWHVFLRRATEGSPECVDMKKRVYQNKDVWYTLLRETVAGSYFTITLTVCDPAFTMYMPEFTAMAVSPSQMPDDATMPSARTIV